MHQIRVHSVNFLCSLMIDLDIKYLHIYDEQLKYTKKAVQVLFSPMASSCFVGQLSGRKRILS